MQGWSSNHSTLLQRIKKRLAREDDGNMLWPLLFKGGGVLNYKEYAS